MHSLLPVLTQWEENCVVENVIWLEKQQNYAFSMAEKRFVAFHFGSLVEQVFLHGPFVFYYFCCRLPLKIKIDQHVGSLGKRQWKFLQVNSKKKSTFWLLKKHVTKKKNEKKLLLTAAKGLSFGFELWNFHVETHHLTYSRSDVHRSKWATSRANVLLWPALEDAAWSRTTLLDFIEWSGFQCMLWKTVSINGLSQLCCVLICKTSWSVRIKWPMFAMHSMPGRDSINFFL